MRLALVAVLILLVGPPVDGGYSWACRCFRHPKPSPLGCRPMPVVVHRHVVIQTPNCKER